MSKFRRVFINIVGGSLILSIFISIPYFVGNGRVQYGPFYDFVKLVVLPIEMTIKYFSHHNYRIRDDQIPDAVTHFGNYNKQFKNINLLVPYTTQDGCVIELVNLESGEILKEWAPDMDEITNLTLKGINRLSESYSVRRLGHPILLKDSSIIVETYYSLVKIDKNSNVKWVNPNIGAHHSIEINHEDNIWIGGRRLKSNFPELIDKENERFLDDLIVKINPENGDVIFEKSVLQILKDNNIYHLVNGNGNYEFDPIHLNDVQPALVDGDFWKKGDLLISSRNLSTIFLYRPSSNKILWYKQGPWLNQHDPDFLGKNKISVFGNQIYRSSTTYVNTLIKSPYNFNSVFVYNFKNDSITEPYKAFIESEEIKTNTSGRSEILSNGDLYIEETESGKVFIGDTIKKKLSFSRRINEEEIAYINWCRIIEN